jgi:hypothetical protein
MRKLTLILVLTLVLGALLATAAGAVTLVFEAEHYSWLTASMTVGDGDSTGADSGGHHIFIPLRRPHGQNQSGPTDTGNATYKVYIPTEGDYSFWGLAWWFDSCGKSFFTLVDDMSSATPAFLSDNLYQQWHWVQGKTFHLTVGWHMVRLQNREDGTKLDEWLLTTAPDFVPTRHMSETSAYLWRPPS